MGTWVRLRHVVLPQLAPYLAAAARSGLVAGVEDRADRRAAGAAERRRLRDRGRVPAVRRDRASSPMLLPSSPSCWRSKPSWCSRLNDMSPAGAPARLSVERSKAESCHRGRRAPGGGGSTVTSLRRWRSLVSRLSSAWRTARSARWSGRPAAARPRCCASSPASIRDFHGHGAAAGARQARHGVPGAAAAALAHGRAERAARRAGREGRRCSTRCSRRSASPRIAAIIPANCRSAWPAASRWPAPSRSSRTCWCSTSPFVSLDAALAERLRDELGATGDEPAGHDAAGDPRCRRSDRACRPPVPAFRQPRPRDRRSADRTPAPRARRTTEPRSGARSRQTEPGVFVVLRVAAPTPSS